MGIIASTVLVRAYRWRYFFDSELRLRSLFVATGIGLMANNILPSRIGELVRAYVLGTKENISKSTSLATVVLERVFDVSAILLLFGGLVLVLPLPSAITKAGYLALIADVCALLSLFFIKIFPEKSAGFVVCILPEGKFKEMARKVVLSFSSGLQALGNWKAFLWIVFWSVVLWGMGGLAFAAGLMAFHIDTPFWAAFLVLVLVSIGMMIPAAPSSVGPFQFFVIMALGFSGISESQGLGFALGFHAATFVVFVALGIMCILYEGIPVSALRSGELS